MNIFKSIQTQIALSAGICLLITVALLSIYSGYIMYDEAKKLAVSKVLLLASSEAEKVKKEINLALDLSQAFSDTMYVIPSTNYKVGLDRKKVMAMIKAVLIKEKTLTGFFVAWEPNAFDKKDNKYKCPLKNGKPNKCKNTLWDETGRFVPYFSRNEEGTIKFRTLGSYRIRPWKYNPNPKPWYTTPRTTKRQFVTEPYPWSVQGKEIVGVSTIAPIIYKNKFYGLAGTDIKLDYLQHMADDVDAYRGYAHMTIMSNKGVIMGYKDKPDNVNKLLTDVEDIKKFKAVTKPISFFENGFLKVVVPIQFGDSIDVSRKPNPWMVRMMVSEEVVLADVYAVLRMAVISGIVLIVIGIIAIFFVSGRVAKPIRIIAQAIDGLGKKDFNVRVPEHYKTWGSELGEISRGFANTRDNVKEMLQRLSESVGLSASKMEEYSGRLKELVAEVKEIVSHATGAIESSAAASIETAKTVDNMAESINDTSKQSEELEKTAINAHKKASSSKEDQINAEEAMKKIGEGSQKIEGIIGVITEIANQTNLLSLNAAIEAAKAGDFGKGFAVVADEVRNLAERSNTSVTEIRGLIDETSNDIIKGPK